MKELTYSEFLKFTHSAPINIFFKDTHCRYYFASQVCELLNLGGEKASILGKTDLEVQMDPELGRMYYEDDKKILSTGVGSEYVSEIPTPEGVLYYEIKKEPVFDAGKVIGIVGIVADVTERIRLEKQVEELSLRDGLTGLYNRNYLRKCEAEHAEKALKFPFSLIMADCNYLKRVNDNFGHNKGDTLLQRVSEILVQGLTEDCAVVRMGGDEFMILCNGIGADGARRLIAAKEQELAAQSSETLPLSVAFGFHTTEKAPFSLEEAYRCADEDMFQNKKEKR